MTTVIPDTPASEKFRFPTTPDEISTAYLEAFPNQHTDVRYQIHIAQPEFTSVCTKTGLPDFGSIEIIYEPQNSCIELKAFKYYLLQYRNVGMFYENVTNKILKDFVTAIEPHYVMIRGTFSARGGIDTTVTATYGQNACNID